MAADHPSGQDSDRDEFLALLAQHEAQLLGFLYAVIRNHDDAEDLFQQTVLTMWQKFAEFEPGTSFVAWGSRIGRYHALNFVRQRRGVQFGDDVLELLASVQVQEDCDERLARRRALSQCLGKLNSGDRQLIQEAYSGERTIAALAEEVGRSVAGVYNSLARIRGALFRCIQATVQREARS